LESTEPHARPANGNDGAPKEAERSASPELDGAPKARDHWTEDEWQAEFERATREERKREEERVREFREALAANGDLEVIPARRAA
jgi:hypothetical protein